MKNKFLLTIALTASVLTSCNMDLEPKGMIDENKALESVSDAMTFRNGFYTGARAITSSQFITSADIQTDMFNGLTVNGNRMGEMANGNIFSSNSDIEGYWNAFFYYINNINFFLEYAEPLHEKLVADNEEENAERVALYIAEGHFFRGYYYSIMFDRWCEAYSASIADTPGMGLPIVTKYNPTPNRDEYPGRSTIRETIEFFNKDIQEAYTGIKAWEDAHPEYVKDDDPELMDGRLLPNACYISSWCCKALQARIALWTGDYDNAIAIADEVINCGIYTISNTTSFVNMWKNDQSTEIIFMPYESTAELGNAIGATWLNNSSGADYIPTSTMVDELKKSGVETDRKGQIVGYRDCRYTAYIVDRNIKSAFGNIKAPCFNKFPGNATLNTTSANSYINRPKPFRLTEMYFIQAEAAFNKGDETMANDMMKKYMKNRIKYESGKGYTELTGNALIEFIRLQKGLEFVGEGFRLSDLRRWKMGFNRADGAKYEGYADINSILTPAGLEVEYTTTDHRYTWPIPSTELQVNPQMAGQQNPGY